MKELRYPCHAHKTTPTLIINLLFCTSYSKAKYSSTVVQFLDFEEDDESGVEDVNDSQLSLEDDQDIEGCVNMSCD